VTSVVLNPCLLCDQECGETCNRYSGTAGGQISDAIKVLKSSARADEFFQALERHFWFSAYGDVVAFVDGEILRVQQAAILR
jgi:hypothetical protein